MAPDRSPWQLPVARPGEEPKREGEPEPKSGWSAVTSRSPVVTAVRQVQMSQIFSNDDSQQSQTNIFPMKIWNILENSRI